MSPLTSTPHHSRHRQPLDSWWCKKEAPMTNSTFSRNNTKKIISIFKARQYFYSCWHILYIYWHSSDSGVFPLDTIISYSPQAQPPPLPSPRLVSLYVSNIVPLEHTWVCPQSTHREEKAVSVSSEATFATLSGLLFLIWLWLLPHLLWTHGTTEEEPRPGPPLQVGLGTVPEVCVHTDQINWTLWCVWIQAWKPPVNIPKKKWCELLSGNEQEFDHLHYLVGVPLV